MLSASSMAQLHSIGQDKLNQIQHDLLGHVLSLALASASCDSNVITSGTMSSVGQNDKNEVYMTFLAM